MLTYLWAKFCKRIVGSSVRCSKLHKTSKIEPGCNILNTTFAKYSFCGYNCTIINCDIGAFCSIANNVSIGGARHPIEWVSMSPVFYAGRDSIKMKFARHERRLDRKTIIGNDVWIGEHALIKGGIKIGDGAVIGMGSVVTKDVPPYAIVAGCPARIIRKRFDEQLIEKLLKIKWWDFHEAVIHNYSKLIKSPEDFIKALETK